VWVGMQQQQQQQQPGLARALLLSPRDPTTQRPHDAPS
jgi:hypothetical protein